jgi:hypothetical protein
MAVDFVRGREAEGRVQLSDNSIFRSWYVVGAKRPYTHLPCSLHGDIHRFAFELSAEHAATHDPSIELDHIERLRVWPQNHHADQTVVAEPIDEAELKRETSIGGGELCDILERMPSSRRIKLICLSD